MLSLTATELPRFVNCNGFRLLEKVAPFEQDNTLRDEGDAAHWLAEEVFKGNFIAEELIDRKAPNGFYIDANMVEHCEEYIEAIKGKGNVEVNTSYSGTNWEVRGRADHEFLEQDRLFVDDYKYGWKLVEPEENWTLISHVFGLFASSVYSGKNINDVCIRIFQPRPYHPKGTVREWVFSVKDLWEIYWAKLLPMLENPTDQLNTSVNCYRCPSMSLCPAAQKAAMNALEVTETAFNSNMTPAERSFMLDQMSRAEKIIKDTKRAHEDAALHEAKRGVAIPNYSIQSDLSNEQWKEGTTPEMLQMLTGKDLSKKALITPGQAKKAGASDAVLKQFYERKNKGSKLVRISDNEQGKKFFGTK